MLNWKPWLVRAVMALFSLFMFCLGGWVAGTALHDSDTCWLLAQGRWIVNHGGLPMIDPISPGGIGAFATIQPGLPPVQYQWLPEIIFYLIHSLGDLTGLLIFTAVSVFLGYIWLPFDTMKRAGVPYLASLSLIVFLTVLASGYFTTRPQIFSFLYMSFLLWMFIARDFRNEKTAKYQALCTTALFLLWVNSHIFYTMGVAIVLMIIGSRTVEWLLTDRRTKMPWLWMALTPVGAALATLINPWGAGLSVWFVKILHSKVNDYVHENEPLALTSPPAVMLILLAFVCVAVAVATLRRVGWRRFPLLSLPLSVVGVYIGFSHARLVLFSIFFLMAAIAELCFYKNADRRNDAFARDEKAEPAETIEGTFARLTTPTYTWQCVNAILVIAGVLAVANLVPPKLPQGSVAMDPPFAAITFLEKHRPPGAVLNAPEFGSIMAWYSSKPDVFIDTRFSFFEEERIFDYQRIALAEPGWQDLVRKYNFNWAFMPPDKPISRELRKAGWTPIFEDKTAVVLVKPESPSR